MLEELLLDGVDVGRPEDPQVLQEVEHDVAERLVDVELDQVVRREVAKDELLVVHRQNGTILCLQTRSQAAN